MKTSDNKSRIELVIIGIISFLLVVIINSFINTTRNNNKKDELLAPFLNHQSTWVDSLMNNMTLDEKIGNLLIYVTQDINNEQDLTQLLELLSDLKVGGVSITTDSLLRYIELYNLLQSKCNIPILFSNTSENGAVNLYNENIYFPDQIELNSINDDSLIVSYERLIAYYNKKIGNSLVFNSGFNNVNNVGISDTAYISKLLKRTISTTNRLQQKNILSCIKTFNSTLYKDSIKTQKIIEVYKTLINNDVSGFCVENHDSINFENTRLSTSELLTKKLNFKGLIFTKVRNERDIKNALLSDVDILLVDGNLFETLQIIKKLVQAQVVSVKIINAKVKKTLLAKSWSGMEKIAPLPTDSLKYRFSFIRAREISRKSFENSIVVVNNKTNVIPFKNMKQKFHIITIGDNKLRTFEKTFRMYSKNTKFMFINSTSPKLERFIYAPSGYENVVIAFNNYSIDSLNKTLIQKISALNEKKNVIVVNFNNIENIDIISDVNTIIHLGNSVDIEQSMAAEVLFGGIGAKGVLPFNTSNFKNSVTTKTRLQYSIPEETGLLSYDVSMIDSIVNEGLRAGAMPGCQVFVAKEGKVIYNKSFGYHTYSRKNKVKWNDLYDIASLTKVAATTIATMKMYDKNKLKLNDKLEEYYKDTKIEYTRIKPDTNITIDTLNITDIIDIEVLVKDKDTIHINDTIIVAYDTLFSKVTPKRNIFKCKIKDIMVHKSGLPTSMPIQRFLLYKQDTILFANDSINKAMKDSLTNLTRKDTLQYLFDKYYSTKYVDDTYTVQIAKNFYLRKEYEDTLWMDIKQIRVNSKNIYQYSDVNMIILQQTLDTINDKPLNKYLDKQFYAPLGLQTICYQPLDYYSKKRIIPTEEDKFWRKQLIHGYVHDPSAALMGGIAGNAGLFSNATDLGILFQMLLNKGNYGDVRYIKSGTVDKFTAYQLDSYRGLGFDKAIGRKKIVGKSASKNTFGHTGFTGTCIWVDPDNDLVYVFLSNRVNPSAKNWRLNKLKIRQRVHEVIYRSIEKAKLYKSEF